MVMADADLIKWTLENLIKNSIDALSKSSGKIEIKAFKSKKYIHVQVSDTGKGMPKKMFKKIFRAGVTTKQRGWGLGLSLAYRIIKEYHNGKIRVLIDGNVNIDAIGLDSAINNMVLFQNVWKL